MLLPEHGATGLNFVSAEAHVSFVGGLAARRTGVKRWDTAHNLLASQAMCFNVFGHLRHHPDVAAAFFTEVLGEAHPAGVERLEIEHHSDAITDKTAFGITAVPTGAQRQRGDEAVAHAVDVEI